MRAFLSYDIVDPVFLEKVSHLQNELKSTGADLKLVNADILHFTIRFLGEIDEEDKLQIVNALRGKVENFELDLVFRGIGAFPDERRISVIWIGLDPSSASTLEKQALTVNSLLKTVQVGGSSDPERFSPHVTIARVRSGRNKDRLVSFIYEHKNQELGSAKIKNLRLKLSHLTPSGPEYSDLHVFES
ncbi:MAG: RNA 2',3'-cyclic phosphodiesterase [Thaumarchaeota archaeon]|nr:RNA 2',3'-cyclic phosphodiesterase [Nitrososphaerota archaeon]